MKKQKIRLIVGIITITICVNNIVCATTNAGLNKKHNDINEKINKINSEISDIKEEKNNVLDEINSLNSSIFSYKNKICELTDKINLLNLEIEEKQEKIKETEEKYEIQKKLLNKRLIALYEAGSTSYLEVLLQSKSLSDFISKYYLVSTIAEADEELLEKLEYTRRQIEYEKQTCESAKEEIKTSKDELENQKKLLDSNKNKKQKLVSSLSEEEKELQKKLEEMEEDREKIAQELAKVTSSVDENLEPSKSGYINPIKGKTKANITTDYHGYITLKGNHTGVDFACGAGTPVVAVKDGTVVISKALKNPNGTYRSYGEYIAIDHYDGTVTIYAHLLENSRKVSVGTKVLQGEKIGEVGSTGKSTGAHLHFEVRINNGKTCVDPKLYLK